MDSSILHESYTANIYNNIVLNNIATQGSDLYIENDGDNNFLPSTVNLFNNDFDQSAGGTYIHLPFPIDSTNLNNLDPLFVDAINGDYHLHYTSPCKDTGDNNAPQIPLTDMDNEPRIMDYIVDMGADEYPGVICTYSISPTIKPFSSSGGTGSVSIMAPVSCGWTASSNVGWINITSGGSGSGNGTVGYSVSSNSSTSSRNGTMTIAGKIFTVTQSGVGASSTSDILWYHSTTGMVYVWEMDGISVISLEYVSTVSDLNWQIKGIGDFK